MLNISQVILVRTDSNLCRKELTVHWSASNSLIRSPALCKHNAGGWKWRCGSRYLIIPDCGCPKGGSFFFKSSHNSPETCFHHNSQSCDFLPWKPQKSPSARLSMDLLEMFKHCDDLIYPTLTSHCVNKERDTLCSNILDAALDSLYTDMGQNHGQLTLERVRPAFVIYLNVSLKELGGRIQIEKNVGKKLSHRKQVMLNEKDGPSRKRPKACTSNSTASSTDTQDPSTSAGTT